MEDRLADGLVLTVTGNLRDDTLSRSTGSMKDLSECLTRMGEYAEALEVCKDLSALLERGEEAGAETASQLREREMQCWIGLRDQ